MLATACTLLFSMATIAALGTIAAAVLEYGPQVAALRVLRFTAEPPRYLTWGIVERSAACEAQISARSEEARVRSNRCPAGTPTSLAA